MDAHELRAVAGASRTPHCPDWCVIMHGVLEGEEDWVHVGAPVAVDHRDVARLCMTVDPTTGEVEGPLVLVGATEYRVEEAERLGGAIADVALQVRTASTILATMADCDSDEIRSDF